MPVISFDLLQQQSREGGGFQSQRVYSDLNTLDRLLNDAETRLDQNEETKALAREIGEWRQTIEYARSPEIDGDDPEILNQISTNLQKLDGFQDFLYRTDENGVSNYEKIYGQIGTEFPADKTEFNRTLRVLDQTAQLELQVGQLQYTADSRAEGERICREVKQDPVSVQFAQLMSDYAARSGAGSDNDTNLYRELNTLKNHLTTVYGGRDVQLQMSNRDRELYNNVLNGITNITDSFSELDKLQDSDAAKRDFLLKNKQKLTALNQAVDAFNNHFHGAGLQKIEKIAAKEGENLVQDLFDDASQSEILKIGKEARNKNYVLSSGVSNEHAAAHFAGLISSENPSTDLDAFNKIGETLESKLNALPTSSPDRMMLHIYRTNYQGLKKKLEALSDNPTKEKLQEAGKAFGDFISYSNSFKPNNGVLKEFYDEAVAPFNAHMKNSAYDNADMLFEDMPPVKQNNEPKHKHAAPIPPVVGNQGIIQDRINPIGGGEGGIHEENLNIIGEEDNNVLGQQPARELPTREKSWKNYLLLHHLPVNEIPRGKHAEYLAKSMAASIMNERARRNVLRTDFDVNSARYAADTMMKKPAFKHLMKDPARVRELLQKSGPELAQEGSQLMHPFSVSRERQRQVLQNLQSLAAHMDGPENRSSKWRSLVNSISRINLNSPETYEQQLEDIFDKNAAYMKGKKSIRNADDGKQRFNQSLDVLGELSKCGTYAKDTCESLFDRTNEVRRKHDADHVDLSIDNFGLHTAAQHRNNAAHPEQANDGPEIQM